MNHLIVCIITSVVDSVVMFDDLLCVDHSVRELWILPGAGSSQGGLCRQCWRLLGTVPCPPPAPWSPSCPVHSASPAPRTPACPVQHQRSATTSSPHTLQAIRTTSIMCYLRRQLQNVGSKLIISIKKNKCDAPSKCVGWKPQEL